jgi:hypothetical protein
LQESTCAHNTGLDINVNFDFPVKRISVSFRRSDDLFDTIDAIHLSVTRRIFRRVDGVATDADLSPEKQQQLYFVKHLKLFQHRNSLADFNKLLNVNMRNS